MKFQLAINMERMTPDEDMREVERHTLEMVQMADEGGFDIVWAAEHHALEMTIAPNPFQILTWWAAHTKRIRLGTAVVVAPYWHPIDVAGEAALLDLFSGGRLEFGIGSGAYQREFDRMRPGLKQSEGYRYMQEMLPAVKALWAGDYAHEGQFWSFPTATSVPKPLQKPHPPIWVAARSPVSYDMAVKHECNILSWPLTRPMSEVETYRDRLRTAMQDNPGKPRPVFASMRHTVVYEDRADWQKPVQAAMRQLSMFENLFKNLGDVEDGFPKSVALAELANRAEYDPKMLHENLMFGTPEEVVAKLRRYQELEVDHFTYYASLGLDHAAQKRSLRLFIDEVMPAFAEPTAAAAHEGVSGVSGHVRVERRGHVLEVTLDKPKVNAIDHAMSRELGEAFRLLREDPELRVAILTGAGERIFSAGWDLKALNAGDAKLDEWWADGDYGEGGFAGLTENWRLDKPVVVALNGLAIGGGFELAMAGDLIIAADSVEFALPEMPLGMVPDAGAIQRLPRRLPYNIAMEMLLLGRRMGAEEAARYGLVNRVVEADALMSTAREWAGQLAQAAPLALQTVKEVLRAIECQPLARAFEIMRTGDLPTYRAMLKSEDAAEGVRAFVEKRAPDFRGR